MCFFTNQDLMKTQFRANDGWKERHKAYRHDLSTEAGVRSYLAACEAAASMPPLTDRGFFQKLLGDNAQEIGPKKQIRKRRAAERAAKAAVTAT